MTGVQVVALFAAGAAVAVAAVVLLTRVPARSASQQEQQAAWCEDGFLDHMDGACRHAPVTSADRDAAAAVGNLLAEARRTTAEALAEVDLQLVVMGDLLEVWPADPWALQRRDDLLDERSRLMAAAPPPAAPPPAPGARVVRQATRT